MALVNLSVASAIVAAVFLLSLGMQGTMVMAQGAPAPGPGGTEGQSSGAVSGAVYSVAGVLVSLLAIAAGFAQL